MLTFWILVWSIFLKPMTSTSNPVLGIYFDTSDMIQVFDLTENEWEFKPLLLI